MVDFSTPTMADPARGKGRYGPTCPSLRLRFLHTPSTLQSHMAQHAIRAFGRKALADVRPGYLQAVYASLIAAGRATTTVRYVHAVCRKALQDAVEFGLLTSNPADRAKRPRYRFLAALFRPGGFLGPRNFQRSSPAAPAPPTMYGKGLLRWQTASKALSNIPTALTHSVSATI